MCVFIFSPGTTARFGRDLGLQKIELRKAKLETMTLDKKRQIDSAAAFRQRLTR